MHGPHMPHDLLQSAVPFSAGQTITGPPAPVMLEGPGDSGVDGLNVS